MAAHSSPTPVPAIDIDGLTAGVPRGSWVALSNEGTQRVAVGPSVEDVIRQSEAKGEPQPLVVRVPETADTLFL